MQEIDPYIWDVFDSRGASIGDRSFEKGATREQVLQTLRRDGFPKNIRVERRNNRRYYGKVEWEKIQQNKA